MNITEFVRRPSRWLTKNSDSLPVDLQSLRAVFLHLPKTAGTSVQSILSRHDDVLCGIKQPWLGWQDEYTYKELSEAGFAAAIRERLGEEVWDRCFTSAFVRNPWVRAVSLWKYLTRMPPIYGISFGEFLTCVENGDFRYSRTDHKSNAFVWHVEPMYPKLVDAAGRTLVDFVGRVENLQEDFDYICDSIGIERTVLPRLNRTQRRHYSEYYDGETRRRVAELYSRDIEYFEYSFDESAPAS